MKDYFLFVCQNRKATSIRSRTNKLQAEVKKAKEKHASLNPSGSLAITLIFENTIFPIIIKEVLEYTWCMWTQGLEYTWCMWTQGLEYTLPMLFFIFVRLLRQCTPSCSLLKYTYTKLSQLQPWAPAAATSADSTKCLHSRST